MAAGWLARGRRRWKARRFFAHRRWPDSGKRPVVFLIDASSGFEARLLRGWIEGSKPASFSSERIDKVQIPASRRPGRQRSKSRLESILAVSEDALLVPLRVAWLPKLRNGERSVYFRDLWSLGDPRDPGRLRQLWVWLTDADRCRIIVAEPAPASELRRRWLEAGGVDPSSTIGLADFVARQATLALERAERAVRGARYKVPRLVEQEIFERPAFQAGLESTCRDNGGSPARVSRRAAGLLREIAATHSPFVIDLAARLIRHLYRMGYGSLLYDREQLAGLARLGHRHPVVFLPTHKSNLDHLVLQAALHDKGLPPNHTAGGINMNFFPIGPLVRRSGVFFIRRSFRDDELYKHVLRSYVDYLIEKRFSLEWYIEGGRSRSGKLQPPRFGLLSYVVDAFRRGKSEDVILVPVSIAYDQVQEVGAYAAEQLGARKRKESFRWMLGMIRAMRRPYGDIHIRFGEPVSLRDRIRSADPAAAPDPDDQSLDLRKLAFDVCVRINRVTPITPTSLVTLALLGVGDRAVTVAEARRALERLVLYAMRRKLPSTADLEELQRDEGVRAALDALVHNDVVSRFDEGPECVYRIGAEQQLAAAYYRNTVVHFFVHAAIAELAVVHAAESEDACGEAALREEALRLRDLLKFEFFFPERDAFLSELVEELAFHAPEWRNRIEAGPAGARALIEQFSPLSAHRVLKPFLESYQVVGDRLGRLDPAVELDRAHFLRECVAAGKQYHLQRRIHSASSVSVVTFENALRLAENRGLLATGDPGLDAARRSFAEEIRDALRRVYVVDALAASRRAGFLT